jgi:hypothetical protein
MRQIRLIFISNFKVRFFLQPRHIILGDYVNTNFKFHIETPYNPLSLRVREGTIKFRLKVMKDIFLKVENLHKEEYETLVEKDRIEYESTSNNEGIYNDIYVDQIRELDHLFYRSHRISTILTLYAMLESTMMKICHLKQKELNSPFSVTDLAESGIKRCKNYLAILKVTNFLIEPRKSYWDAISLLGSLRNFYAHAEGDLESTFKLKEKTILGIRKGDVKGLHFEDETTLMVSDEYILKSFLTVESALIDLCNQ